MPPYGLNPTGWESKPLTVCKEEMESDFKAAYGTSVGSNPDGSIPAQTKMGQLIGIMSEKFALLWELGQAIHSSTDPDKAQGVSLDSIAAITGTIRNGERFSTVIVTATGDPGTVLAIGRVVSVQGTGVKFDTTAAMTLVLAATWAATTAYVVGDRVVSDTPEKVYECTIAGTSGMTAPTGTGSAIVDGTVTWRFLGDGSASADAPALAEVAGPYAAVSGTLTEIETPVSGWKSAINILDATIGDVAEKDPDFRIRRENELAAGGEATVDAIRAHMLRVGFGTVNAVKACTVFQNTTLVTNMDGLPGKSIEALVLGGLDQEIREAVFHKAGGIESYGNVSGSVTDTAGNPHTVKFSRATVKDIWVEIDLQKIDGTYPINGDDAVKAAIIAFTEFPRYSFGVDVVAWALGAALDAVPGVFDVTAIRIGLAAFPVGSARITIGPRELAAFDTSRIVVTSTNTTP